MRRFIIALALLFANPAILLAEYTSQEILVIPWGDAPNQLKIDEPGYEDVNNTPEDGTDDWIEKAGPSFGFVDKYEDLYFSSYYFLQLKGLDRNGRLIFDYSHGEPSYNREFYRGWLRKFYVDSLCRIYILGGADEDYIAVVDTAGNLIEKLSPLGPNSGVPVANMYAGSHDAITFYLHGNELYTYVGGQFHEGGSLAWLALDGYYYYANLENSSIRFIKYRDPDIHEVPANLDENFVSITGGSENSLSFIGVDDSMQIYIFLKGIDPADRKLQIYNLSYNLISEIVFPQPPNKYMWYMKPYMRPSDGNIYEFRVLDDGLHVIRWSKQ